GILHQKRHCLILTTTEGDKFNVITVRRISCRRVTAGKNDTNSSFVSQSLDGGKIDGHRSSLRVVIAHFKGALIILRLSLQRHPFSHQDPDQAVDVLKAVA